MRKLKLQVQMSVDGYIAGPNGEMDWMVWDWDDDLNQYVKSITELVDCIVLGRKLAQGFIPHWAAQPQGEDNWGTDKMNNTAKVVFTKTLARSVWDKTVLAKGDLVEEITNLKKQDGKDIIAYGGAAFVSSLIKHGLIDEFHLFINPAVIGDGMPIFKELDGKQNLTLIKSTSFRCGMVVLHYEQKREKGWFDDANVKVGLTFKKEMVVTVDSARKLALSFDEAVELPHFQLTSFRIRNKIFATMDTRLERLCLMLSPVDQSVFSAHDPSVIYPVPNKWGKKGATYVELSKVRKDILRDAMTVSYCAKAPRALAAKYIR